ncbi:DNA-binding protein SMUBP-2-like [Brevipalpus obovatus]|uniref:DNA-binding protein SMUBP-2-like n=1 Tax=Brevipalpus obovatus TaxID=246614 RepID=UPI003D9F4500
MASAVQNRSEFVTRQRELILLEECAQRDGSERIEILNLTLVESKRSVDWGDLLIFSSQDPDCELHKVKFSLGDDVHIECAEEQQEYEQHLRYTIREIYCQKKFSDTKTKGVIKHITTDKITVNVRRNHKLDLERSGYHLRKVPDSVTFDRLQSAICDLEMPSLPYHGCNLDHIFFGDADIPSRKEPEPVEFFDKTLDESQREAVQFALAQDKICLIYGPPGTGKTTTIVELVRHFQQQKKRILVCSPSNIAVDNILEKLAEHCPETLLRLGNPARVNPGLQQFTFDVKLKKVLPQGHYSHVRKTNRWRYMMEDQMLADAGRSFELEMSRTNNGYTQTRIDVLAQHSAILGTLTSASPYDSIGDLVDIGRKRFDVVIIDECSQALQTASWIVLPLAKKAILVGDPQQLPPIVSSRNTGSELEKSLMHLCSEDENFSSISIDLRHQYRMHEDIMTWSSDTFYLGSLKAADDEVRYQSLESISNLKNWPTLLLVDTNGCNMFEVETRDDSSFANQHEVEIVTDCVEILLRNGVKEEDIGVITPYKLQLKYIMSALEQYPNIAIKTIDGFQGREKEVIIISLVRSNPKDRIGFLADHKRINVAITRAKKHFLLVCDTWTVSADRTIESLISYMKKKGKLILASNCSQALKKLAGEEEDSEETQVEDPELVSKSREKFSSGFENPAPPPPKNRARAPRATDDSSFESMDSSAPTKSKSEASQPKGAFSFESISSSSVRPRNWNKASKPSEKPFSFESIDSSPALAKDKTKATKAVEPFSFESISITTDCCEKTNQLSKAIEKFPIEPNSSHSVPITDGIEAHSNDSHLENPHSLSIDDSRSQRLKDFYKEDEDLTCVEYNQDIVRDREERLGTTSSDSHEDSHPELPKLKIADAPEKVADSVPSEESKVIEVKSPRKSLRQRIKDAQAKKEADPNEWGY